MSRFRLTLALGLSAAFAVLVFSSTRRSPERPPTPPRYEPAALDCAIDEISIGRFTVTLRGRTPLPDGTPLTLYLSRFRERNRNGRLEPELVEESLGSCAVWSGRFSCDLRLPLPGSCRVRVEEADPQRRRRRDFDVPLWKDEQLFLVDEEFRRVDAVIKQLWELANKYSNYMTSEHTWRRRGTPLILDAATAQTEAEKLGVPRSLFPAAVKDLPATARLFSEAPAHFFWTPKGDFGGAFDTTTARWIKDPDGRPLRRDGLVDLLMSPLDLLRREYALWIMKEVRRSGVTPIVVATIRSAPKEVQRLVEGLDPGGDVAAMEERLRGEARPRPPRPDPPVPAALADQVTRYRKVEEARKLLAEADAQWGQFPDEISPRLYKRLEAEYADTLEDLGAASRVRNRARD